MDDARAVEVRLWSDAIGVIAPLDRRAGFYAFQYRPEFAARGIEPSPIMMPIAKQPSRGYSFTDLDRGTFQGLPGLIADALPDRFGNALITEYLSRKGRSPQDIGTLDRLCYVGRRAMGALEFQPALGDRDSSGPIATLEMAGLVEDARRALRGNTNEVKEDFIEVGSSAGGARAKAVIGWNRKTDAIVSGQFDLGEGFEHWLLKFDVGTDKRLGTTKGFGRIEYAHYLLARAAGIVMSECHLLEEGGRAHFMTKRFDRIGNEKVHVQSLCAIEHLDFNQPRAHGYEQYLRAVLKVTRDAAAVRQAWLRCAFNVAFVNCDDHTKNLAFTMDPAGTWSHAPAYDMCYSYKADSSWVNAHQMKVGGKDWDITRADLLKLARDFEVDKAAELLDGMLEVRATWPKVAKSSGVPKAGIEAIAKMHPALP